MTTDNTKPPGQPVCGDSDCNSCERWPVASSPAINAASMTNYKNFDGYANRNVAEMRSKESSPAMNAASPTEAEAMIDTDQVPHMIVFDDHDRQNELVIGGTLARYRFKQISASWNAHLFVKIASSSRDEKYPSAILATPVGQGSAPTDAEKFHAIRANFDTAMKDPAQRVLLETVGWLPSSKAGDQDSATSGEAAINAACRKVADLFTEGKDITAAMVEYRAALAAKAEQSPSGIDLWCVIQWLEGGRDPKLAAQELRLVQAKIEAAKAEQSNTPAPRVGGNAQSSIAEWDSLPYAKHSPVAAPVAERAAAPASALGGWKLALHAAVSAIYFDDSSDYKWTLGAVVRHLDPKLAAELLGSPKAAYDKACAMISAAPEVAQPAAPYDNSPVGAKEKE